MHSTPSMPMSKIHRFGVCFQNESLGADGVGTSLIRSTVEADAAKPHLAGVNQDSWSTRSRCATGIIPPQNTSCEMTNTTSIGMICSLDRASADSASPSTAPATEVPATFRNSPTLALPTTTSPCVGPPLPYTTIATRIADWMIAGVEYTRTLASRYAVADNPTACSR